MTRSILQIDEYMSMSYDEICLFIEHDDMVIIERHENKKHPNIDLKNMSDEEIAKKYNYSSIDSVKERIKKKLNK